MLVALVLALAAARSPCQQKAAAPAESDPKARAAMLRASVILKIAPYLSVDDASRKEGSEYRIAIVGTDAAAAAIIATLPGKKVDAAAVVVAEIDPKDAAAGKAPDCELLYIAASIDDATAKRIVEAYADKPVAIVSERAGFAGSGGGVQLFVQDNNLRFEVNADVLKKQGVRASPQLLKLSRKGPA